MSVKIATPISSLFKDNKTAKELIELSDILELRDNSEIKNYMKGPYLYHSRLNILAKWYSTMIQQLKRIKNDTDLELISFHIMSCYQKNGIMKIHGHEIQFGLEDKMSYEEMLNNIKQNIEIVKDIFSDKIKIQVENIPYLPTNAYDEITDPDFISSIIKNNLYFLLDIPHAVITSINTNKNYMKYIQSLPLNKCLQIHISGWSMDDKYAVDSHDKMNDESWKVFNEVFKLTKNKVQYVTLEYYKDKDVLKKQLVQLKEVIQ